MLSLSFGLAPSYRTDRVANIKGHMMQAGHTRWSLVSSMDGCFTRLMRLKHTVVYIKQLIDTRSA